MSGFAPVRVLDIEISEPLPSLGPAVGDLGIPYAAALCLVRLGRRPLGRLRVDLPPEGLDPKALAARIEREFGRQATRHLCDDGAIPPGELRVDGVSGPDAPRCAASDEQFLKRAPSVSVIIPTRNRPERVVKTLRSILRSRYPSERYEVIVVDNASGTEARASLQGLEEATIPVRLLHEEVSGASRARNKGLESASGEIVVFADDDVDVDRDWLAMLVRCFDREERVGAASGLTMPSELETPAQLWLEGFGRFTHSFAKRRYDILDPPLDEPLFPFNVGSRGTGPNMAFRREVLVELGGFDIALGPATPTLGGEDIEALLRVLLSGRQLVCEPAAIVWHAHPREYRQFERRMWAYGVGLTACLTKAISQHPGLLPELLRKLPHGLAYALAPGSAKNQNKQHDYPRALTRLELRGMAYGPLAYARSRPRRRVWTPSRHPAGPPNPRRAA